MNRDGTLASKDKKKNSTFLIVVICLYNCIENFLLFLMLLNSSFFSNAFTTVYFVVAMYLTFNTLVKDEKFVRNK